MDPDGALGWLGGCPVSRSILRRWVARCGELVIRVTGPDARPTGFRALPFDHLALRVGDVDATLGQVVQGGAGCMRGSRPMARARLLNSGRQACGLPLSWGRAGVPVEFCAPRGSVTGQAGAWGLIIGAADG